MRATILAALILPALHFAVTPASGEEITTADHATPVAEAAAVTKAEVEPIAAARTVDESEEFRIPPGFRVKKRGKFTLYCRKEEVMGTRFASEKCYDETGIREMLRAQAEDQEKVDQMRRICGSQAACGGGG